eukprot:gene5196-7233_t
MDWLYDIFPYLSKSLFSNLSSKSIDLLQTTLNSSYSGFSVNDAQTLLGQCLIIWAFYAIGDMYWNISSLKGKSWLVMFFSSGILTLFGVYYLAHTELDRNWNVDHIYSEEYVSRFVLLFFMAANIMDLALGITNYPEYMDPLSTIAHHFFYIAFIAILLYHRYSTGFMLCFPMELPTFVLATGTIWKSLRSDLAFGISFLLTRIMYNIYLAYQLAVISYEGLIWKICVGVLVLHLFWFSKWLNIYGSKLFSSLIKSYRNDRVQSEQHS